MSPNLTDQAFFDSYNRVLARLRCANCNNELGPGTNPTLVADGWRNQNVTQTCTCYTCLRHFCSRRECHVRQCKNRRCNRNHCEGA